MAMYAINDTTLTAIGDAIRSKTIGTSELPMVEVSDQWIRYNKAYPVEMPSYVKKIKITGTGKYNGFADTGVVSAQGVGIASGYFTDEDYARADSTYTVAYEYDSSTIYDRQYFDFETIVDSNTFTIVATNASSSSQIYALTYTAVGLDENGNEFKYTPLEMADAINDLEIPNIQPIELTDYCSYACSGVLASQFIDMCGDKISTKDITSASNMFYGSQCEVIPFEINCKSGTAIDMGNMFNNSAKLQRLPKINNAMPSGMQYFCSNCYYLQEVPEDYGADWDWSKIDNATSVYAGSRANTFAYCGGLRKLPMKFLEHGNPVCNYSYSIYNCLAEYCYALDEIVGLPIPHAQAGWTSNSFSYAFDSCNRAQRLTFKTAEDGSPVVVNWKNQVINLTNYFGYAASYQLANISLYSGIDTNRRVKDDATYQALKNDPDWFTEKVEYSRYNHDSAVETINSLPDCSASGGTNTIKFYGNAGSLTDGGAINTLTEEEIAVATAKGWTVTLS